MAGDGGLGRSPVVRERGLSLRGMGGISGRARRSPSCRVEIASEIRQWGRLERLVVLARRLLRRGAKGAGRAKLQGDVVCRVQGVWGRGFVRGLIVPSTTVGWGARGRHGGDIFGDVKGSQSLRDADRFLPK